MQNTWPDGQRCGLYQSEHDIWNATHYPGTRQLCVECNQPTGRCEDDSIYIEIDSELKGPLCENCYINSLEETTNAT